MMTGESGDGILTKATPPQPELFPNRTVITSFGKSSSSSTLITSSSVSSPSFTSGCAPCEYDEGVYVLCMASPVPPMAATTTIPSETHLRLPVGCALSDGSIRLYDRETLKLSGSIIDAHGETMITDLCYFPPDAGGGPDIGSRNLIASSGMDGHVRIFDWRSGGGRCCPVIDFSSPRKCEEALSLSIGYGGMLTAVGGSKGNVHFYDLRNTTPTTMTAKNRLLGSYVDAHTDEVTNVKFHPSCESILVTAAEDGLMCTFDTSKPTEESALQSVMNVNSSVRNVGFFGPNGEGLFCLTGSETISFWHHDSAQRLFDFDGMDVRTKLGECAGFGIDYLIGCHWDGRRNCLSLLAGSSGGDAAIYKVDAGSISLMKSMRGGHKGCIRAFDWSSSPSLSDPRIIVTGGEDARLVEWSTTNNSHNDVMGQTLSTLSSPEGNFADVGQPTSGKITSGAGGGPARRQRKKPSGAPYQLKLN